MDEEHTPSGKHVTHLTPFPDWVPADVLADAEKLSADGAKAALGPLASIVLSPSKIPRHR